MTLAEYEARKRKLLHHHDYPAFNMTYITAEVFVKEIEKALLSVSNPEDLQKLRENHDFSEELSLE